MSPVRHSALLACLLYPLFAFGGNTVYPLVQEEITGHADYGSGAGQSFILPAGATIYAIELHIEYGDGSVELNLWQTYRGPNYLERNAGAPEASGVLLKEGVIGQPPGWFRITLDQPYTNPNPYPEELVFDLELLTFGRDGWNDYSFSDQNPYTFGSRVSWSDHQGAYSESPTVDLAFRIITDNTPAPTFSYYDYSYGVEIDGYLGTDSDVVIPETLDAKPVLGIRREIFYDAEVRIETVSVPASVEFIETGAFTLCCNELTSISVAGGNANFSSQDGVLFNKSQTTLLRCPDAKTGNYIIPNTVTLIESDAFRYCAQLTGIQIPEGVTRINSYAFASCGRVTSLTLPSTLTRIGASAFSRMGIRSITIPSSLTRLETRAFQDCRSLESVSFESGFLVMSSYVFYGCTSLTSLRIPSTVTAIGALCFYNCSALEALYFEGTAPDLVNTVFGNNPYNFGLYYPAGQTGYSGEDWDSLPAYAYTGPAPASGYARWLARQGVHTETADSGTIPGSNLSYLMAFALDLDLSQSLPGQMPSASVDGASMELTFYADADGVGYSAKASIDLLDWDAVPVVLGSLTANGERTASVDVSSYDQCFLTLEIQKAE